MTGHARRDLVIVGGGPGGSLTAALVRRQDPTRSVLLLEREAFPRHHVGESTIPSWEPILERAGVLETLERTLPIRKVGGRFHWGVSEGQSWTLDFRDPARGTPRRAGFHVDRATFDDVLLRHAEGLGVTVHERALVTAVTPLADGGFRVTWQKDEKTHEVEADWVVDASGQARALGRALGTEHVAFDDMNNFALWGYWKNSEIFAHGLPAEKNERWTYIATAEDGWLWHIPISEDLTSVGLVTDKASLPSGGGEEGLEAFYRKNVMGAEVVGDLLKSAELVQHPRAPRRLMTIRDWSYRARRLSGPGWFLVGDAGLFVDPILSTGLLITANAASMAANALHTIWNDGSVDRDLLFSSYDEAYADVGESFHRLAQIWYSRNFKSSTWHWEAKRQRLRAGGHPAAETDAQAFLRLCMGSLADPLSGASTHPLRRPDSVRLDVRIMAKNLFGDAAQAGVTEAQADVPFDDGLHDEVARDLQLSWRKLLTERLRVTGCSWTRREQYFTDASLDRWERVPFVELRPVAGTDAFDRVVFPSLPELPNGLMPLLDGTRDLRSVLVDALARHVGSRQERGLRVRLLEEQVLQLELRGWLERVGPSAATDVQVRTGFAASWRQTISRAAGLANRTDWVMEVDLFAESVTLRPADPGDPSRARVVLTSALGADPKLAYARTTTTHLAYSGELPLLRPLVEALVAGITGWERAHAEHASELWSLLVPSFAGARERIGP